MIANDRFGALRDVRKMLNGRAMDPIQDVVRRYIDRHSSKDSEYLANLQATWLEVAEAVGYDIKNGDDASLVSLVEDLAEFKADAVKKYKKEHPYAPNDSPVDNELLSWIQNMANDRKYLAKLLKQISDGDYPLPPLVIEKKLTRKQQTKIDTYDDLVKMFGPESDGMVWMTVNKLKNDLAKANETPSRDTNTHIANMLRKAFNTKNKVIYKGEKLQEFFDKAKTSTISELMELVEQIDRIK